jgi:hypothetical protein
MEISNKVVFFLSVLASAVVLNLFYEPISYIAVNYVAIAVVTGPILAMLSVFDIKTRTMLAWCGRSFVRRDIRVSNH